MSLAWIVSLLWKSIEIQKSYFPTTFLWHFTIHASKWGCLQKPSCESVRFEDIRNVVVSVSHGPCYHFCSQRGLWPVSGDSALGTSGSCSPSTSVLSKEAPTQFTLWCTFCFSSMFLCAEYSGLGPTSGPPEISAVGTGTSQRGAKQPSACKTFCTILLVSQSHQAQSCCVRSHWRAFKCPTLNPHTELFVPEERKWCCTLRAVNLGMFCAKEGLSRGWLTGWKNACKGPGDSSWTQVMWNQVGRSWLSPAGGWFWGCGTLARWIRMGNSLYCMSSLPWPQRRKEAVLRGTAMHATSEFVLHRGCWFMLQGEWENCCICKA